MAWVAPITFVSGAALTAAQLNVLSGDLNETAAAKATASGQWFVSTAANTLAARTPDSGNITGASQGTTSSAFVDLTTVGPSAATTTGTIAIVVLSALIGNDTANGYGDMGYAISGATTLAANTNTSLRHSPISFVNEQDQVSKVNWQSGITAGSNTFTAKYRALNGGTAIFNSREIIVIPVN